MPCDLTAAENACASGRCEETIGLLEASAPDCPGNLRLFYWLGICYGGSCHVHSLVHLPMAEAYLQQALRLAPPKDRSRAAILDQLANTALAAGSLRAAIDFRLEAAEIYRERGMAAEWARAQFNLGNSFCDLAETTGENHWPAAIAHFEQSLTVRTRASDPERYAALLENLGSAWRRLPPPEAAGGIRQAILCYRRALPVYTRARYPEQYAALQNNLGNAFLALSEAVQSSGPRHCRRALHHFANALAVERDPRGRAFGIAQYNRAQAFLRLAGHGGGNIGRAAACLKAAVAAFEACDEQRYLALIRRQLESLRPPASPAPASLPRAGS